VTERLNFGGDLNNRLDAEIVFRIRHWEIRKVVNGHKSAAHTDSSDGGTGKTCLGGGMQCRVLLVYTMQLSARPVASTIDGFVRSLNKSREITSTRSACGLLPVRTINCALLILYPNNNEGQRAVSK